MPEDALREALLNALCHKQYQSGVPIQISVYEDKLYIANCGCLPENWTLENLMRKHASSPYNPYIAHVFYLAGFIESWGRGIEKICSACQKDGVPLPVYTINPSDIMIEFTAPENRVIRSATRKVTDRVTEKVSDHLDEKLDRRQKKQTTAIFRPATPSAPHSYTLTAHRSHPSPDHPYNIPPTG